MSVNDGTATLLTILGGIGIMFGSSNAAAQPLQAATGDAYDPDDLLPMFDGGRWDDGGLDVGDGFRVPYVVLVPTPGPIHEPVVPPDRPRRDVVVATGVIGAQRIAATVVGPFAPPLVVVPVER